MNFYKDNSDIQAHLHRFYANLDADTLDTYERVLALTGELAAERLAPTAEETDARGNILAADGSVTYAPGVAENLRLFAQAGLMGFTLPEKYGGCNLPTLLYAMATDIVSRADASFMNLFGLQGIAETINSFASDEIKDAILPRMASGEHTGAMALTEPDAGSDLQAVKTIAYQNEQGEWFVRGVKRFITNGCADVLVVLARTEPNIADGRGLSCLVVERGERVKIRRLENKLGIHGSPTCEIFFDDAPAKLIGKRQRGLITYVMALMNGARVGIAAQSCGIAEAAYRAARSYAASRRQFGCAIEEFPAVRDLLAETSMELQAARTLTYEAAYAVDVGDKQRAKFLTPLAKYYASETAMRAANNALAVLGGSGYMRDYPVERYLRDARITTIYEGTSQLQVVAALGGIASVAEADARLQKAFDFAKDPARVAGYKDLVARTLVDMSAAIVVRDIFNKQSRGALAKRWAAKAELTLDVGLARVLSLEASTLENFNEIAPKQEEE